MTYSMSKAKTQDAGQIAVLVNTAYRGETSKQGWTTEADLLAGRRTDVEEILQLISTEGSMILLCKTEAELLGSVHLQKQAEQVCLGMLAVSPPLQGRGIGKQLLDAAEQAAKDIWAVNKSVMTVIACRHELIAFYQRRGYLRTGAIKEFPLNPELKLEFCAWRYWKSFCSLRQWTHSHKGIRVLIPKNVIYFLS